MLSQVEKIVLGFLIRLQPSQGAPLFSLVSDQARLQMIRQMVLIEKTPPGAVAQLELGPSSDENPSLKSQDVEDGTSEPPKTIFCWGQQMAAALIDACAEGVKKPFLDFLIKKDAELYHSLRPSIFLFEDFVKYDDIDLQKLLIGQDLQELALALYGAPEEVKEKFLSNLSNFNQKVVTDELGYLKEVEPESPEAARDNLVMTLREQVKEGELPSLKS